MVKEPIKKTDEFNELPAITALDFDAKFSREPIKVRFAKIELTDAIKEGMKKKIEINSGGQTFAELVAYAYHCWRSPQFEKRADPGTINAMVEWFTKKILISEGAPGVESLSDQAKDKIRAFAKAKQETMTVPRYKDDFDGVYNESVVDVSNIKRFTEHKRVEAYFDLAENIAKHKQELAELISTWLINEYGEPAKDPNSGEVKQFGQFCILNKDKHFSSRGGPGNMVLESALDRAKGTK